MENSTFRSVQLLPRFFFLRPNYMYLHMCMPEVGTYISRGVDGEQLPFVRYIR